MAIANVVQRGQTVYAYNERCQLIAVQPVGGEMHDGLKGFSGGSFTLRRGGSVYVYDEENRLTGVYQA